MFALMYKASFVVPIIGGTEFWSTVQTTIWTSTNYESLQHSWFVPVYLIFREQLIGQVEPNPCIIIVVLCNFCDIYTLYFYDSWC